MSTKDKPLSETNPYLKDPVLREFYILRSVVTSHGVEGINCKKLKERLKVLEKLVKEGHELGLYNDIENPIIREDRENKDANEE